MISEISDSAARNEGGGNLDLQGCPKRACAFGSRSETFCEVSARQIDAVAIQGATCIKINKSGSITGLELRLKI